MKTLMQVILMTAGGAVAVLSGPALAQCPLVETQPVVAPDGTAGDLFGISVAASGVRVIVGVPSDDRPQGSASGSAHIYRRKGGSWVHEQMLTASNWAQNDLFGFDVDIEGDVAVIGAFMKSTPNREEGGRRLRVPLQRLGMDRRGDARACQRG